MLMKESKKFDDKVGTEEERTKLLFDITELIEDELVLETVNLLAGGDFCPRNEIWWFCFSNGLVWALTGAFWYLVFKYCTF